MPDQDGVDLPLDDCLREVLALQPHWTSENTPEMERRGRIIRKFGPAAMRRVLEVRLDRPPFDWSIEGRDGTGLKTRVPWMRVYSKAFSPSATEGWYLVYLFAFDGQAVYLSLNQGTTVANAGAFKMRPANELTARADWARTVLTIEDPRLVQTIDLADNGELAVGYQRGNVLAIRYDAQSIPDETMLTDDLVQLTGLLGVLYETPGAPEYSHTTTGATIGKPPALEDEVAFVDWMRNTFGPTLVPTRAAAEQQARDLLDERAGSMTVDEGVLLGQLFNRGEWGGIARQNRFVPAFVGVNMEGLLDPIDVFNEVTERLWRDPIDDAIALVDRILVSKDVLTGAGRSYPTMLLYLRDPERFAIWLRITHRGLQAFGRLEEPVGRNGGAVRYRKYCAAAQQFAKDHQLAPQEIDAILAEAARVAKADRPTDAAEIAALIDDAVEENTQPGGAGTDYPLEQVQVRTHLPIETLEEWVGLLRGPKKQALFYGPPGTGKTFVAQQLARHLAGADGDVETVQFHPSYSYEDFIEGLRPVFTDESADGTSDRQSTSTSIGYQVRPGAFHGFCERARSNDSATFVFVIDEINRAELGAVLGELMMLLEYRKTTISLPYSQKPFSVPENVILLATMNTADRSLALVDFALRRRFHAFQMLPDRNVLISHFNESADDGDLALEFFDLVQKRVNSADFAPGHSYWMGDDITAQGLFRTWRYELFPYLAEYWFENRSQLDHLDADVTNLLAEEA